MGEPVKNRKPFIVLLFLTIIIAVALFIYQKVSSSKVSTQSDQIPAVDVIVSAVAGQDVPMTKEWVGTTQGDVNADIFAKVSGYLIKKAYKEGATVQQGDVLFEIDPRPYKAALDQAQGVLEQAKSNQKKSLADVIRYKALVVEGAVSQKEYIDAVRTNDMNKAAITSAKASLEQAKLNLGWTKVTSPISGVAGIAIAQEGDLIDSTKKLTTVSITDPMKISFPISENEYIWYQKMRMSKENLNPGDAEVTIVLNDGTIYPEKGKFAFTDRQIDQNTGTMTVQVVVANHNGFLRPGQYAKVRANVGTIKDAMVVPRRAVIETQGITQIATVNKENKVEMKTVKLGYIFGNKRVVESGLDNGDTIIVEGFLKTKEGTLVNPKKEE